MTSKITTKGVDVRQNSFQIKGERLAKPRRRKYALILRFPIKIPLHGELEGAYGAIRGRQSSAEAMRDYDRNF